MNTETAVTDAIVMRLRNSPDVRQKVEEVGLEREPYTGGTAWRARQLMGDEVLKLEESDGHH